MDLTYCKKFHTMSLLIIRAGVLLASVFLFSFIAQAQTDAAHEVKVQAAIQDLSSATGQTITSENQARDLCNQEQYLDVCADVGKKHDLYTKEEVGQVDQFLTEVKGKILDDIKSCLDEECLVRVANELAKKIQVKNPTLATSFKLTTTLIEEKNAFVQAAKEVGVSFKDCEAMDPDTASVELLRQCAKLAKDSRVQKYIPQDKRALADQFSDTTLVLKEALAAGKYQCGDNTLEGCGNYCLNPSAAALAAGIPEVCRQIATEVFGPDGVKQLEAAHQQVGQVKDYYAKKFILVLPDGKELVGEGQIRNACDRAFSERNLGIARSCGSFAVKNGFASQAEVDKGLKLMESFVNKGQDVNFDDCLTNPASCRDFIPENERERFDVGSQIFQIMKEELGFEPFQCERGTVDQAIGAKCLEGSKKALARIESLGLTSQSQEARFIVEDIKRHVAEGKGLVQRKDQFRQVFEQKGGPGGCKSESECFTYCSNPANGPECIAFGAQQNISGFRGQEAVQKFQEYNYNIQKPGFISDEYRPFPPGGPYPQYPGQGPYPGFQPPGQGYVPPGQVPGFTQPGPGFSSPPGTGPYYPPYPPPYPGGPGSIGPSPECFAAIQSGDYVKAKTACYVPPPSVPFPSVQICPASPYVACPAGEYRESYRNNDGCWIDGPCRPVPTYSQGPYPTYTQYPGPGGQCPSFAHDMGGYCMLNSDTTRCASFANAANESSYTREACGSGPYPTGSYPPPPCPPGQWWDGATNRCTSSSSCGYGSYWDPVSQSCKPSGPTSSPGAKPQCSDGLDNDNDGKTDYPADPSCYGPDDWDEYYPKPGEPTYTPPPSCPAGQWWDYAYNKCTSAPACSVGYYWDEATKVCKPSSGGSVCSQSLINLLGTGCHWMYSDSSGRAIYCNSEMNKSAKDGDTAATSGCSSGVGPTYSPYPTYSSYPTSSPGAKPQCSDGLDNDNDGKTDYPADPSCYGPDDWDEYYPTDGGTGSCPSFAHVMPGTGSSSSYCMLNNDTTRCAPLGVTSESSYGSCSVFGGGSTYTPLPSCPAGQSWNYSTSSCQSNTSSGSCPSGSHIMYVNNAGGYCMSDADGSKCGPLNSTSVSGFGSCSSYQGATTYTPSPSCPSGQWWDYATSSCKSSTSTYTPPPSCPAGQWWDYNQNKCSTGSCSSGYYWDSATSTCKPSGGTTYSPYPTATSCGAGYFWDSASNTCKSSCPSTQYWNGSACVDNVSTTYTPYPTSTYTYTPPPSTYTPPPTYEATPPPYSPPPTTSYSPPPTSYIQHQTALATTIMSCDNLGGEWDVSLSKCKRSLWKAFVANISRFLIGR